MSARNTKYHTLRISAYTLIEILVSLTIIGILFGFGYVNFRDFSRRQALAGAVKQVQGDLRLAQQMGLSGQKPAGCGNANTLNGFNFIVVSATEYKITASCVGATPDPTKDVILPTDISINSPKTPAPDNTVVNPLLFKVLGNGNNIPGTVEIELDQVTTGAKVSITVTSGGEIK